MTNNKPLFERALLPMIIFGFLFAGTAHTQHFTPVAPTGEPRPVVVENATIDGVPIVGGDEIGVFDDTLCVGSVVFSGTFNATITLWMEVTLPDGTVLPGAESGNPISFKVWQQSSTTELNAAPTYSVGTGTFGEALTVVTLASTTAISIFTVINTNDSGTGSLRDAIAQANSTQGPAIPDTIKFNIPGAGPHTISPTSALPTITDPVVIDGLTQPGASCDNWPPTLLIELDGTNAGNADGLRIQAGNSTVRGLVINRFTDNGIVLNTNGGNVIQCNFNGTDVAGIVALGNGEGILVTSVANTIGGPTVAKRNLISGNNGGGGGIVIVNTTGTLVQGNFIGTDVNGSGDLGNTGIGVFVGNSSGSQIGGTTAGERNIISGNDVNGIRISNNASGNSVQGNFIGTDASGTGQVGNAEGIRIDTGAFNNTIGGTTAGARNIISGNGGGVVISDFGNGTTANIVQGNFIGTDVTGTVALGNGQHGVTVDASNNTIGGTTAGAGNVISANASNGVFIGNVGTGNLVQGNFIGTDVTGTAALGNIGNGVVIIDAPGNTIGGTSNNAGNVISGNNDGIEISGSNATGNVIQGNFIGTDASGTADLGNSSSGIIIHDGSGAASNNTIGGTAAGARNIISGNDFRGVWLASSNNTVSGNYIGTDVTGTVALGNSGDGIVIEGGTQSNIIGGTTDNERNIISGNGFLGIWLLGSNNTISGNYIGTDVNGTAALANGTGGISLHSGAANNIIGGTSSNTRNVLSGNDGPGISLFHSGTTGNLVQGNFIGTDVTGAVGLGNNADGVFIAQGASNNSVGGTTTGAGNVISGNQFSGVALGDVGTDNNTVEGNFIGTDLNGTADLGNGQHGVTIGGQASNNTIGGTAAGSRNVISGNDALGIGIFNAGTTGNLVQGNFVGRDATGTAGLGNNQEGIVISQGASNNTVGGTVAAAANVISDNGFGGVRISNSGSTGNQALGNSIFDNNGLGIDLEGDGVTPNDPGDPDSGPNNLQNFPVLANAIVNGVTTTIAGTLNSTPNTSNFRVEFFLNSVSDPSGHGEGRTFLGTDSVDTDGNGDATIQLIDNSGQVTVGSFISATATDPSGNTSEFSATIVAALSLAFRVERSTGDVFAGGSFTSGGADLAERINVSEPVEPGDVVELDPTKPTYYRKARGTSDWIAGVITTEPGFTLGNNPEEMAGAGEKAAGRPMLALMGRVPVKVTAENGPIHPGDLLTVASKSGYAMRCTQVKNCEGAMIGKALETLEKGEGKILVLVMSH